ncbi:tribbles homolog 2-like [Anneissia japonica]|uniref:tribbles homolog 2-like n=1 Tax=Anneissia japonica TaxID=1529436 RepID=UPI0014258B63|nr:tribbles homolog 2-like [Anneissia japonica]
MSVQRSKPIAIQNDRNKGYSHVVDSPGDFTNSLSPNLSAPTPPDFTPQQPNVISKVGNYLLVEEVDSKIFKAVNSITLEELICKAIDIRKYQEVLKANIQVGYHENINQVLEILLGDSYAYAFFERDHGDMHSHIRSNRKLSEDEAKGLFKQIVAAVMHCHSSGVVLRDLKLRKFVFRDNQRTRLKLDRLDDAYLLENVEVDAISDKHGCPAYVSPEILTTSTTYSGRCADVWSLGVMLYTMLVGRYPFHDSNPSALFEKIRRGKYTLPDSVSSQAKCLIRSMLRVEPSQRLTASEILDHPWFKNPSTPVSPSTSSRKCQDQLVPDSVFPDDEAYFFQ